MFKQAMSLTKKSKGLFSALLTAGTLSLVAQSATADVLFVGSAVNNGDRNRLVFFSSDQPGQTQLMQIQGLQFDERILCLDVRPANGQLYAVSNRSQLYILDLSGSVAVATPVGNPFTPALVGDSFGCGFNPNADRLRIVSDANHNLSVNPNDGVVTVQTNVAYVALDANAGQDPGVAGADYTNNDNDPATGTTLYDIDSTRDVLATQNPPASGQLATVGMTGVNTIGSQIVGFDIFTISTDNNIGYAAMQTPDDDRSKLYSVDLATGAATFIGEIGGPTPLTSLAILP